MDADDTIDWFGTGAECRAKASSLRAEAKNAVRPAMKARLLQMAEQWEMQAAENDFEP
jgi:hypothetical protein